MYRKDDEACKQGLN